MNDLTDGRAAAWISAWECVQAAQKLRVEAMKQQDKRAQTGDESDASHYFSQVTQGYNGLMEEARIYASLAAVTDQLVGMSAGEWLAQQERARREEEDMRAMFAERFEQRKNEGVQDDSAAGG